MQPTYRQIWAIASPILVSLLMENLIGITDTAFLGRVGEVELGASALGGVLYLAVFMLGFGFSIGAQILIARRNGERAYAEIGPLFRQGFAFLLALAAAMFVLSRVLAPVVLGSIVESEPVRQAAVRYTNWRVGKEVSLQEAARRAGICMWNTLAALERHLGSLDRIRRPVKLLGFVAGTEEFTGQAEVINAASQVLMDVFGEEGRHARSAIGAHSLPLGLTVEIESIFEIK